MDEASGFQVADDAPRHYNEHVEVFMAPFVQALIDNAVDAHDAVLDVACGTGFATRAAAAVVGTNGRVVGIDLNAAMITTAESVSQNDDIVWYTASALDLPFADDEFDAVICQQGIQFFPDVSAGLTEMARVVRPGGHLAATVWTPIEESPFIAVETTMLIDHCNTDPSVSGSAFPVGGEREVRSWFVAAGLDSVEVERIEATVTLPPVSDFVPQHLKALPWSAGFFALDEAEQRRWLAGIDEELDVYRSNTGFDVPFCSYLAYATV